MSTMERRSRIVSTKIINFAVCRYIPDILRDEFINVGVLVHIPSEKFVNFYKTRNYKRILSFDDEVEIDVIKAMLESLEYQFNTTTVHSPDLSNVGHPDFLTTFTSIYVNQLQFSNIRTFSSELVAEDIRDLCDTYLYYDKKKSDRIGPEKVRRLVSKMFTASKINSLVDRKPKYKNMFQQQTFDFSLKLNDNDTLIKVLSFDYKNKNKFFKEVKSTLFDIKYFKDMDIHDIKIVINNTDFSKKHERSAFEVLSGLSEVYTLEQFSKYIDEAEKKLI